jgi:hypothetical protein
MAASWPVMPSRLLFSKYPIQMYFIVPLLLVGTSQHSLARWIVHRMVKILERLEMAWLRT